MKKNPRIRHGFTLIELLVVIAIIAILASILLPALERARQKAWQSYCENNLKQLALGTHIYLDDYNDILPGMASGNGGWNVSDWIYWGANATPAGMTVDKSPIVASLGTGGTTSNFFRCPGDRDDTERNKAFVPYRYSYSMPSIGANTPGGPSAGLSSDYTDSGGPYIFKMTAVHNPADKAMYCEEQTRSSGNPYEHWTGPSPGQSSTQIINDGKYACNPGQTIVDGMTIRHGGRADVPFLDYHVEAVIPSFWNQPYSDLRDRSSSFHWIHIEPLY